jgi:hypothetical protein
MMSEMQKLPSGARHCREQHRYVRVRSLRVAHSVVTAALASVVVFAAGCERKAPSVAKNGSVLESAGSARPS